jgi:hypothetical protein
MRTYKDCPDCACLVAVHDNFCPFCAADLRDSRAPGWLLGVVLGLGVMLAGCNEKEGETQTQTQTTPDGVTYAGPDESWSASDVSVTDDGATITATDSEPDGTTYAGPDEDSSAEPWSTSTSTSTGSSESESSGSGSGESSSSSSSGESSSGDAGTEESG